MGVFMGVLSDRQFIRPNAGEPFQLVLQSGPRTKDLLY